MFKRKLLVIIIPFLATSVLVGAGFGAWYFDSSYIRLEKSLGVKVEDKVETFGFIETSLPEDTVLKIDQGGFFTSKLIDINSENQGAVYISFVSTQRASNNNLFTIIL